MMKKGIGLVCSHFFSCLFPLPKAINWKPNTVALLELTPGVLTRAVDVFPGRALLRTIDVLQLASCAYLVDPGQEVELESCDRRMNEIARELDFPLFDPKGP